MCVFVFACSSTQTHYAESGDRGQLARISSLFPFCARTQTQFFRPGGKHLPLLNHLTGPFCFCFKLFSDFPYFFGLLFIEDHVV